MARKKRKVRADFRKNRGVRARDKQGTHRLADETSSLADAPQGERVSGKGDVSRKRTLAGGEIIEDDSGTWVLPDFDRAVCRLGRVLRGQGLHNVVRAEQGAIYPRAAPRYGVWGRPGRSGRRVLVANVARVLIVRRAAEPRLKPNLIDRFLVS